MDPIKRPSSEPNSKTKRKRKTYSCEGCRKVKTRCDFTPLDGKCHRCMMLKLECSLTEERENEIRAAASVSEAIPLHTSSTTVTDRLTYLERSMTLMNSKLDKLMSMMEDDKADDVTPSKQFSTFQCNGMKLREPPLKLINDISNKLFTSVAESEEHLMLRRQRPFVAARETFMKWFDANENLCIKLCSQFLAKAHFWIIPGGVKMIDRAYATKHTFITSVFAIIAMGFDETNKYEREQEELYPIVERLLTNTLTMFEKLIDHDIEAILYCAMFSISRKSKHHRQLQFNSLVLCTFAINSLLNIINFHAIKDRAMKGEYLDQDLYHLRILNSLIGCRLQYSIGSGNFYLLEDYLSDFNNLTAKYPKANFNDDIKISEVNLGDIMNKILVNLPYYYERSVQYSTDITMFPEFQYWLKHWDELLTKDGAGVLLFSFDYYHILLCRTFIKEFNCDNLSVRRTVKHYCFSLLNGFLHLNPAVIKGAPSMTLCQLVYAVVTLVDLLYSFEDISERQSILNLITKVYWHLNTIGEKLNEATANVGKIIKTLIDTKSINITQPSSSSTPAVRIAADMNQIPDVEQFSNFEEFFHDFFQNMKPNMFNQGQ